jgi:DNA-binding NarL/FixJ family response regulator
MATTRILLVDDHTLMRAGLRKLLELLPNVEVVGEACNGRDCLELTAKTNPHLIVLDIAMPELNGLEVTKIITARHPEIAVIILSMHRGEEYVRRSLSAGARAYVLKDADPAELLLAIQIVNRGEIYLSSSVTRLMAKAMVGADDHDAKTLGKLTPRQREVLRLLAEGFGTKEIANRLHIGVRTVETHRFRVMNSLDIHDAVGLIHFAFRTGLAMPPS